VVGPTLTFNYCGRSASGETFYGSGALELFDVGKRIATSSIRCGPQGPEN
jgi:hypothetical protein